MAECLIDAKLHGILRETGESDPKAAVRIKVRALIDQYRAAFGDPEIPFKLDHLVSLCGIQISADPPIHSEDAELAPDQTGRLHLRLNRNKPETRQRFSIGHELTHTFFPGYERQVQCRPDPRHRDRDDPDDFIETLCDVGASEFLFPFPWFALSAARANSAEALVGLANEYKASKDATIRRFAETSPGNLAAIFFEWKLKPTENSLVRRDQPDLFGYTPEEQERDRKKLRVEYVVASDSMRKAALFIPKHKSVKSEGVIYQASSERRCQDGDEDLDFGPFNGRFRIHAVPLYTPDDEIGPNGESAVVVIVRPLQIKGGGNKPRASEEASLYGG
jgi:hypothetical protein